MMKRNELFVIEEGDEPFDSTLYWIRREREALDDEMIIISPLSDQENESRFQELTIIKNTLLDDRAEKKFVFDDKDSLTAEIENIDQRIKSHYKVNDSVEEMRFSTFPYLRFLLQKRDYLQKKQDEMMAKEQERSTVQHAGSRIWSTVRTAMASFYSVFFPGISPFLAAVLGGSFNFILHLVRGFAAIKYAVEAYRNEKIPQRKTRIVTHALSFMLAGAGAGISISFLAGTLGAAVGVGFMLVGPMLATGFCTAIYGLSLWRNSYVFSRAKEDESAARKEYTQCSNLKYGAMSKIKDLEKDIADLKIQPILQKIHQGGQLSAAEESSLVQYGEKMQDLLGEKDKFAQLSVMYDLNKKTLEDCQEKCLQAEHAVAFNSIDIVISSMTLVGSILGATALLGVSAASFGLVPLALIITGVTLGLGMQVFKHYDTENNFSYTRNIRAWFVGQWDRFTASPKMQNEETKDKRDALIGYYNRDNAKQDTSPTIEARDLRHDQTPRANAIEEKPTEEKPTSEEKPTKGLL